MIVECTDCHKIYNFKEEKVPDTPFSFACKQCGGRIRIAKEKLDANRAEQKKTAAAETAAGKKSKKRSPLAGIDTAKLKKPIEKSVEKSAEMVAEMAEWTEKDWIFKTTKVVAFFSIAFLVVLVILSGFTYFSIGNASRITFVEVQRSVDLKMDPLVDIQSAAPGVKLPGVVKKHLTDEHRAAFVDWMNGLDDGQKKQFIADLERVVRSAEKLDPSHIGDYINEFGKLSFQRSIEKPYAKYFFKYALIIAMVAMLTLLGMFSLILLRISARKGAAGAQKAPAAAAKKNRSGRKSEKKAGELSPASG
jgi:hypothetical protein